MAERTKKGTFAKGNSGGPGRPAKPELRTTLENLPDNIKREVLACQITGQPVSVDQFAAIALACKVGEGDASSIKYLNDHIHGKPKEHIEIEETGRMTIVEELVCAEDDSAS